MTECGDYVKLQRKDFQEILNKNTGDMKIAHKLTNIHVDLPEGFKTSVRGAAVTLSNTTAAAMQYLDPEKEPKANYIRASNDVSIILYFKLDSM